MRFVNTKTILLLVAAGVLLFVIKNIASSILSLRQNSHIVTTLKTEEMTEKQKRQYLKEKLHQVNTSQFIENEAREKLGMVLPGEHIVLAPPTVVKKEVLVIIDTDPNWKKWYKLFF